MRKQQWGFTLTEIMVTIAVSAIGITIISSNTTSIFSMKTRLEGDATLHDIQDEIARALSDEKAFEYIKANNPAAFRCLTAQADCKGGSSETRKRARTVRLAIRPGPPDGYAGPDTRWSGSE